MWRITSAWRRLVARPGSLVPGAVRDTASRAWTGLVSVVVIAGGGLLAIGMVAGLVEACVEDEPEPPTGVDRAALCENAIISYVEGELDIPADPVDIEDHCFDWLDRYFVDNWQVIP